MNNKDIRNQLQQALERIPDDFKKEKRLIFDLFKSMKTVDKVVVTEEVPTRPDPNPALQSRIAVLQNELCHYAFRAENYQRLDDKRVKAIKDLLASLLAYPPIMYLCLQESPAAPNGSPLECESHSQYKKRFDCVVLESLRDIIRLSRVHLPELDDASRKALLDHTVGHAFAIIKTQVGPSASEAFAGAIERLANISEKELWFPDLERFHEFDKNRQYRHADPLFRTSLTERNAALEWSSPTVKVIANSTSGIPQSFIEQNRLAVEASKLAKKCMRNLGLDGVKHLLQQLLNEMRKARYGPQRPELTARALQNKTEA